VRSISSTVRFPIGRGLFSAAVVVVVVAAASYFSYSYSSSYSSSPSLVVTAVVVVVAVAASLPANPSSFFLSLCCRLDREQELW
jgi:hypothetical protein